MKDHASIVLFTEARALIEEAIEIEKKFNAIGDVLRQMGYGGDPSGLDELPFPWMDVTWVNQSMTGPSDIDPFFIEGPRRARTARVVRRISMARQRQLLGEEQDWKCYYCREQGDGSKGPDGRIWHVDHMVAIVNGGDNKLDNLVLACATCNLAKLRHSAEEYFQVLARRAA